MLVNVLIMIAVAATLSVTILIFSEMQRAQAMHEGLVATRKSLTLEIESALQSAPQVLLSLQTANSAAQNPLLDACLRAASPATCDPSVGFYITMPGGGPRLAGPVGDEAYFNANGDPCDRSTEVCRFTIAIRLLPSCPPGFNSVLCPDAKVFAVHYTIRVVGLIQSILRPSDNKGAAFARYAVDIHPSGYGVALIH
ncbi:MAG: hypothetical protein NDI61_12715 [Bdellovibrionaceae bacterium]|nr:hypothetical protein [Pseudobdellovibrionaceae bacterium]